MEEKQIQDFVQSVASNEALRKELEQHPQELISRQGFSPRVARVVAKLVPYLTAEFSSDLPGNSTGYDFWA